MPVLPSDFYARWRTQHEARQQLLERSADGPPEKWLQALWHHQRLQRNRLQTVDGRSVRILHPGFWNREAGPDFRGAVVQIGEAPPRSGDIEIDLAPQFWSGHQHDKNPRYENVVLHVVWNARGHASHTLPMLALEPHLDAPWAELQLWLAENSAETWADEWRGACSAPLRQLAPEQSDHLLQQAALIRFQRKAAALEQRARAGGWEQALWEGLFRALGYRQNTWPMQRLAELLTDLREPGLGVVEWQARLLGAAGFLDGVENDATPYLRTLWNHWWRERERFQNIILPKSLWRMNGLRPANQPHRRLALAAHWLADDSFIANLEAWFLNAPQTMPLPQSLMAVLSPATDAFWSHQWSFHSPRLPKAQALLGESRTTDLAINVILPWFWIRAQAGKNKQLTALAQERYLAWPPAQDNTLLRLARQRLLGRTHRWGTSAASQQGLLQVVRDFCDHSNATCDHCTFPQMIRQLVTLNV